MLEPGDRVLMAVSGGKDSLAAWSILRELGYDVDGLYIGLGIEGYSDVSRVFVDEFATARGLKLRVIDLPSEHGFDVPTAAAAVRKVPCAACGTSKRHLFDEAARDGRYDAVATGHNLDDEAAVLFGNVLHWDVDYLARQRPVLEAVDGFPRKVKPLVRLTEREMAAYCVVTGIDYQVDECPMSVGNRHLGYKDALNAIEQRSPGSKAAFYVGFQSRIAPLVQEAAAADRPEMVPCSNCAAPTTAPVDPGAGFPICGFCRMADKARDHVPVSVRPTRKRH